MGRRIEVGEIDREIGRRIQARRTKAIWSQEALGEFVGVTGQQISQYEKGGNRISVTLLLKIAKALGVEPGYFLKGLEV